MVGFFYGIVRANLESPLAYLIYDFSSELLECLWAEFDRHPVDLFSLPRRFTCIHGQIVPERHGRDAPGKAVCRFSD
jgi:hypothetical protein